MEPNVSRYYKDTRVRPVHHRGTTWGNCLGPETECYFGMATHWWKQELILVKTYLAPVCVHRCPPTKAAFQSSVYFRSRFWEVDSISPWLLAAWSLFVLLASISTHLRAPCRIDCIKCWQTSTVRIIRSSFLSARQDNSTGS